MGKELYNAEDWHELAGKLAIPMRNDYLFKAMLQKNERVRKALIASVLHTNEESITSALIQNPIEGGDSFLEKTFILDIKVLVNGSTVLNMEMQVLREQQWPERSLGYLCRAFDNLNVGDDYALVKPAIGVSFLDFALFRDDAKFFAEYLLSDTVTGKVYTDKFRMLVVNLRMADGAGEEERKYCIDRWAAMFAATTWEELNMLAQKDPIIDEAVGTAYKLILDERERYRMEARELTLIHERVMKERLERAEAGLEQAEAKLEQTEAERDQATAERDQATAERNQATAERDQATAERNQATAERDQLAKQLEEARKMIDELRSRAVSP